MRERVGLAPILIIGGAGYIGSHTAKLLHKKGYKPIVLDDLSTGHRQAVRHGSLHEGSYNDASQVERVLREHKIGTVMHFGAKALVGESVENPLLYYSSNVGGTLSILAAMRGAGASNIIFSSTAATFGEPSPQDVPIHERVAQSPVNPYGRSKLFAERILRDMDAAYGIKSGILRYFNAAGADPERELGEDHRPETHLIPRVLAVALGREERLTVHGSDYPTPDGSCVRDYIHVNDLAAAHIQAMELLWEKRESFDFNLGTEHGYSVLEVIRTAEKVTGRKIPYEVGPRRPGDPPVLVADSAKAHRTLGWRAGFDLAGMIETAYQWMEKHPRGYGS